MSFLTIGCAVFGIRNTEEPSYKVLWRDGNREIRQYEGYLVATTQIKDNYEQASNRGFRRLFSYISGANTGQQDLAMTAPVLQGRVEAGDKIAMTAPVLQAKETQGWTMSFVLPASYTTANAPRPTDANIALHEVPASTVAVLRYSGRTNAQRIARLGQAVAAWIAARDDYEATSEPRSARYDPPFTLPFLRRNEIHMDIRSTVKKTDG